MNLRAMLAALLAVLLLSTACVASACEVACTAKAAHPGCHAMRSKVQSAGQAQQAMTMPACDHAGVEPSACVAAASASQCAQTVCGAHPQLLGIDRDNKPVHLNWLQAAAIVTVLAFPPSLHPLQRHRVKTPTERSTLLVALQATLRV